MSVSIESQPDREPASGERGEGSLSTRKVAVVIPTKNEARHLRRVLERLRAQADAQMVEILISDGGSTDGTQAIARDLGDRDARIRLICAHGGLGTAAANVNRAVRAAAPEVNTIIRIDAHADYPEAFVQTLLDEQRVSGAASVVNHMISAGETCFQRAVAAVSNSRFGTGGSAHRVGGRPGYVDHGHHALFDRGAFEEVGGYDEAFVANEDAELDARLRASGRRIWFTDRAGITYYPRATLRGLARQYHAYGRGRAMTWSKHAERLRPRQLAPVALVVAMSASVPLAAVSAWSLLIPALYLGGITAATVILTARHGRPCVAGALVALPAMHLSWGLGFLRQAWAQRRRRG